MRGMLLDRRGFIAVVGGKKIGRSLIHGYSSSKEVQLFVGHEHRVFDGLLGFIEILGRPGLAGGSPGVVAFSRERPLAEHLLAEPIGVALVSALPERLLL